VHVGSRPSLHRMWGLISSSCHGFAARVVCRGFLRIELFQGILEWSGVEWRGVEWSGL
jgi:hypothetical protein